MDVSKPNNWPRVQSMLDAKQFNEHDFYSRGVSEQKTQEVMRLVAEKGYIAEPHTAIAYEGLSLDKQENATGIFLATAHPAKFKESVEQVLEQQIDMPEVLQSALEQPCLAKPMAADYAQLKAAIFSQLL